MKALIFVATIVLSTAMAHANSNGMRNPQIRICVTNGGTFSTVDTNNDQLPLCSFGDATIGTQALMDTLWENRSNVAAVRAYKNTPNSDSSACENNGGEAILKTNENGDKVDTGLCGWTDGSVIEAATLSRGNTDESNKQLSKLLGL
jgi:putative hemolysin